MDLTKKFEGTRSFGFTLPAAGTYRWKLINEPDAYKASKVYQGGGEMPNGKFHAQFGLEIVDCVDGDKDAAGKAVYSIWNINQEKGEATLGDFMEASGLLPLAIAAFGDSIDVTSQDFADFIELEVARSSLTIQMSHKLGKRTKQENVNGQWVDSVDENGEKITFDEIKFTDFAPANASAAPSSSGF